MREVELSRQAQHRQDKRKRVSEDMSNREVILSESRDTSSAGPNSVMPVSSLSSLEMGNAARGLEMQPTMPTAEQQQQQQQRQQQQHQHQQQQQQPPQQQQQQSQLPQPHQYTLGSEASRPPATSFPDLDRWPMQGGFNYPAEMPSDLGLTQFVTSNNFDSPKDLWKDFPEQFADPSLITSSLYGLPVMSGPIQGQAPPLIGEFASMYNSK